MSVWELVQKKGEFKNCWIILLKKKSVSQWHRNKKYGFHLSWHVSEFSRHYFLKQTSSLQTKARVISHWVKPMCPLIQQRYSKVRIPSEREIKKLKSFKPRLVQLIGVAQIRQLAMTEWMQLIAFYSNIDEQTVFNGDRGRHPFHLIRSILAS